jgi:hypothetical protein
VLDKSDRILAADSPIGLYCGAAWADIEGAEQKRKSV